MAKIVQVDIHTLQPLAIWDTIAEIAENYEIDTSTIFKALKKENHYAIGYYWCEESKYFEGWEPEKKYNKEIVQIDMTNLYAIKTWNSQAEVERELNININNAVSSGRSAGGYYWCKLTDYVNGWKPEENKHYRLVRCIETGVIYKNIMDASKQTGVNRLGIARCCNGTQKTSGGCHWEFVDDKTDN